MNYKRQHDTLNEILFEKILSGGSIRDELYSLRKMAKDCIGRATIAKESENVLELLTAINTLMAEGKCDDSIRVILNEINKKYDVVHDDLFIIAAFENYAKAILLSKKYLVHKISNPRILANIQQKQPVHFHTVRSVKYKKDIFIEHVTIGVEHLLRPKYVAQFNLSDIEYFALKKCKSIRNSIHFGGAKIWGYDIRLFKGITEFRSRIIANK